MIVLLSVACIERDDDHDPSASATSSKVSAGPGGVVSSASSSAGPGGAGPAGGVGGAGGGSACPEVMDLVGRSCVDRFEAPNRQGELPLVMYTFDEADAWCGAHGKRLCFDDEWTTACEGPSGWDWPYGGQHVSGQCNDEELWLVYNQSKLDLWPPSASAPSIETLDDLYAAAAEVSPAGGEAALHVASLYQAEPGGQNGGCAGPSGVFDLCGNVEEWTRRRDGGDGALFSGALKGRYWAEARTCHSAVLTHGNAFRFYEIGFRCCLDAR
jgi:formylglycine-generating enzyme required for sulfatase activity